MTFRIGNNVCFYCNFLSLIFSLLFLKFVEISFFIFSLWFYYIAKVINHSLILVSYFIIRIFLINLISFKYNCLFIYIFLNYSHIHLIDNNLSLRVDQCLFLNDRCLVYFLWGLILSIFSNPLLVWYLLNNICLFYVLILSFVFLDEFCVSLLSNYSSFGISCCLFLHKHFFYVLSLLIWFLFQKICLFC